MRYASICSGIEAASVAWSPLGWQPVFFAENEKFPSAVLAHHYPHIPNRGDITKFKDWPDAAFNILVGGTPCQSFSVAGLRKGLADPRGNLALVYLAIAERYKPRWLIWENVPGVLSSNDGRDFGSFLGGLVELRYGFAYRVLDAQHVRVDGLGRAVPQRRRRVLVVGHLGDWRRAAAVLFERESVCGNTPPRREAGQGAAGTIDASSGRSRGAGTNPHAIVGGLVAFDGQNIADCGELSATLDSGGEHTNRGMHIAFDCKAGANTGFAIGDTPGALRGEGHGGGHAAVAIQERAVCENPDAGPDGAGVRADGAAYTLEARTVPQAVQSGWAVRRLTPLECERLQGFPDNYTAVPYRGKPAADGPRYKALGNSFAVNAMRWLGTRIVMLDAALQTSKAA